VGLLTKRSKVSIKPVARDAEIVAAARRMGLLTGRQIQVLAFSLENYTACKRRLTKLHHAGLLKRLPRQSVIDPFCYFVGRAPRSAALLEHQLGINEIRVRVERAASTLGWELTQWQGPDALQPLLSTRARLAPDAYFQITRTVEGEPRRSGFFLEYERTVRSSNVLVHKLTRYADLYHSGSYRQKLGIRPMRVLVVYSSDPVLSSDQRLRTGLAVARRVGFPLTRFATIEAIRSNTPTDLLAAPLWWRPDRDQPSPLYELEEQA
jgi:hypothetical protein